MAILGGKLAVALLASGIGSVVGLGTGLAAKRPFLQTIATLQPSGVVNQGPRSGRDPSGSAPAAPATQSAPATGVSAESSGQGIAPEVTPVMKQAATSIEGESAAPLATIANAPSPSDATRSPTGISTKRNGLKRSSAHFGRSEIIDPWATKR